MLSATAVHAAAEYELVVRLLSGDKVSYRLSCQPVVSFTSTRLIIESPEFSTSLQCSYDDVGSLVIVPLLATDDKPFAPNGGAANEIPDIEAAEYPEPEYGLSPVHVPFGDESGLAGKAAGHDFALSFIDGRTVSINGVDATLPLWVCDAGGRTVPAEILRSGQDVTIRLGRLPAGVYLIYVNNQSFKIRKK